MRGSTSGGAHAPFSSRGLIAFAAHAPSASPTGPGVGFDGTQEHRGHVEDPWVGLVGYSSIDRLHSVPGSLFLPGIRGKERAEELSINRVSPLRSQVCRRNKTLRSSSLWLGRAWVSAYPRLAATYRLLRSLALPLSRAPPPVRSRCGAPTSPRSFSPPCVPAWFGVCFSYTQRS